MGTYVIKANVFPEKTPKPKPVRTYTARLQDGRVIEFDDSTIEELRKRNKHVQKASTSPLFLIRSGRWG